MRLTICILFLYCFNISTSNNYLCKDSHHSCTAKALYTSSLSKMPCLFCPYSCGLCVICPMDRVWPQISSNNIHLWYSCCTRRNIMMNFVESKNEVSPWITRMPLNLPLIFSFLSSHLVSAFSYFRPSKSMPQSFYDTPTSKKYFAYVEKPFVYNKWFDDRLVTTYAGIAISPRHVITAKDWHAYGDPKNYTIYLDYDNIKSELKLTPIQFIKNVKHPELYIIVVKEIIPNEYIIPLTTVLDPDGRIGHYMGIGTTYVGNDDSLYGFKEGENKIVVIKDTKYSGLKDTLMVHLYDIKPGSPLLITEGSRYVLQGILMHEGAMNKKACGYFFNIGEELEWINKVIN